MTPGQRSTPAGFPWPDISNPLCVLAVNEGVEERPKRRKRRRCENVTAADWSEAAPPGGLDESSMHPSQSGHSWTNVAEAEAVVASVGRLLCAPIAQRVPAASIGVVTFYKAQAELIRRRLDACTSADCTLVECSTVDSFQGREKEVILVSCVRAQSSGRVGGAARTARANLGFLRDGRRLNVALTRAKRGLIVVCHPPTLANSALLAADAGGESAARTSAGGGASSGGRGAGGVGAGLSRPAVDGALCLARLLDEAASSRLLMDVRQLN